MNRLATLTLNPAIDGSCEAERIFPTHKIRTRAERYDPGGGGINVARVLSRLGQSVEVIYLAGGATGALLDELLDQHGLTRKPIPIHDHTRQSLSVFERASGKEYRFVPEGPQVRDAEWRAAFDHCAAIDQGWLIASGSLPPGVPPDFYARLAAALAGREAIPWREAATLPLVLLTPDMQNRKITDRVFRELGCAPVPSLETNSIVSILAHVRTGPWSGILPRNVLDSIGMPKGLCGIPLIQPDVAWATCLVVPHHQPRTPIAQALFAEAGLLNLAFG